MHSSDSVPVSVNPPLRLLKFDSRDRNAPVTESPYERLRHLMPGALPVVNALIRDILADPAKEQPEAKPQRQTLTFERKKLARGPKRQFWISVYNEDRRRQRFELDAPPYAEWTTDTVDRILRALEGELRGESVTIEYKHYSTALIHNGRDGFQVSMYDDHKLPADVRTYYLTRIGHPEPERTVRAYVGLREDTVHLQPRIMNARGHWTHDGERDNAEIQVPKNEDWTCKTVDAVLASIAALLGVDVERLSIADVRTSWNRSYLTWIVRAGSIGFDVYSPMGTHNQSDRHPLSQDVIRYLRAKQPGKASGRAS